MSKTVQYVPLNSALCTAPPGTTPQTPVSRVNQLMDYSPTPPIPAEKPPDLSEDESSSEDEEVIPVLDLTTNRKRRQTDGPTAILANPTMNNSTIPYGTGELPIGHIGLEAIIFPTFHQLPNNGLLILFPKSPNYQLNFCLKSDGLHVKIQRTPYSEEEIQFYEREKGTKFLATSTTTYSGVFKLFLADTYGQITRLDGRLTVGIELIPKRDHSNH
jgi:hypothetical protein